MVKAVILIVPNKLARILVLFSKKILQSLRRRLCATFELIVVPRLIVIIDVFSSQSSFEVP